MSDTTQPSPPPPSTPAPAPPAPPPTEVPVNETPVNSQTPIGSQAPPKPASVARREALENAYAKATQAQQDAKNAKNAENAKRPGMGHNKPPEAMAKEPEKPSEKAERTSRPSEAQQRYREGGKFAKDPAKVEQPQPAAAQQPGQQAQPARPAIKPLDERAPYREPPGRFSEQAKQEWHSSPESVRGAVYQMAREFQGAYEKYKGDHGVMEELRPYHDLTVKQGTTLRKAFDHYYGMEQKLRQDLVGGVDIIVQNLSRANGWKGANGGPLTVQDFAMHVLSMSPEQHQMSRQQNSQTSAEMRIGQLHQQVERQNEILNQMVYQQRFAGTRAEVDRFAEQHPRFDELADQIKIELDLGFPLEQAYARADKLRPSDRTHAPQTRNTPAQTRKTSISGAPDGSTRPSDGQRRGGEAKHPTRQEALARAFRRVGNGV